MLKFLYTVNVVSATRNGSDYGKSIGSHKAHCTTSRIVYNILFFSLSRENSRDFSIADILIPRREDVEMRQARCGFNIRDRDYIIEKHRKCITVLMGRKWRKLVKKKTQGNICNKADVRPALGCKISHRDFSKNIEGWRWAKIGLVGRQTSCTSSISLCTRYAPAFLPPTTTHYYPIRFAV